eukprot:1018675-Rhodomonas_salina.1
MVAMADAPSADPPHPRPRPRHDQPSHPRVLLPGEGGGEIKEEQARCWGKLYWAAGEMALIAGGAGCRRWRTTCCR